MSLYPSIARPRSLKQAGALLDALSSGSVIIAGGQELMPHVNYGALQPDVYVDVGAVAELKGVREDGNSISIGALTVHRELQRDPLIVRKLPLLAESVMRVGGGRQVHNRGTIGGNIVSMHPLYDVAPSLLALQARVEFLKAGEVRCTAFADLIKDTSHGLGSQSILIRVLITPPPVGTGHAYEKLKSSGGAYGSANAAALVTLDERRIAALRVAIGAVSDKLIDASEALTFCVGEEWSPALGQRLQACCTDLVDTPLSDHQGDADWRRSMAGVSARRAIECAISRAQGLKE